MSIAMDLTGQRFGRYVALDLVATKPRRWRCHCDCGEERVVRAADLRRGSQTSCGCRRRDTCTRHGHNGKYVKSATWQSWSAMLRRCRNPAAPGFERYGGRGIVVCERWLDFVNFLADMGERPEGTTLDRRDNDGNYEPDNCRWATPTEQQLNTRSVVKVEVDGETVSLIEASRRLGVDRHVIRRRLAEHGDPRRPHATERRRAA